MTRISLITAFFATIMAAAYVFASPISVPLDHWSYHFIERLQAKGALSDSLSSIKPYSRDEMADMIICISKALENGETRLSAVERDQLESLKRELAPEVAKRGATGVTEYRYLLNWSSGGRKVVTEIGLAQSATCKRGTDDYESYVSTLQVVLQGNLKDGLYFYSDNRASYEHTDEPLPLWCPYLITGRYPWNIVSDAYLIFRLPWVDLQVGKDAVLWGPGHHGVIGLSGVEPTFDIVKLPIEFPWVKFINILGFLRDDLIKEYKSDVVRKYLSAHRIEIRPFTGLCIGWQEVYIYAENLHIELLNPVMPYQMAEDYLGDAGNNTTAGDIDLCILPNTRLYASLFLDDFHPNRSFFKANANRWAVLGGVLIVDPFGLENFDFRAEYARVEPWVYPHKGIVQNPPVPLSYKHFDTPLGHWIGPNADDLFFETNYRFSKALHATLSYSRIRKGEIGGSIYDYDSSMVNAITEDAEKRFLMGIVEKTKTINLGLTYRIFHNSTMRVNYSHTRVHNKQTEEAKLPSSDERKQPWETGRDWVQNVVEVSASFRY